ncbi:MAG: hypothetical protein WAV54_06180 [Acidimicrobiales bacterium]
MGIADFASYVGEGGQSSRQPVSTVYAGALRTSRKRALAGR